MDFMRKRKLNALLNGLGSRPTTTTSPSSSADYLAPDALHESLDPTALPQTPPSTRTSNVTVESASSTIRTPGSDSMALRQSLSSLPRSTNSADLDTTKRRRVGLGDATPSKSYGAPSPAPVQGGTTIKNVVLRKWNGNKEKESLFKPKYCPGDRDELLKRLASFQEFTDWTPKPDPVNEVQWAKRGWICNGKERVRCTLCNKELVVKLNRKEVDGKEVAVLVPSEIEDALVQKYVELIVTSHQDDCLWRKRGCDDSLLRLPLSNRQNAIHDLRKRYDELCARRAFLPYEFNLRLPDKLKLNTVLTQLPPDFFSLPAPPPSNPSTPNRVALALAILGWQGLENARIGPVPNTASCHTCLRRLGLWMFKSKEVDPETNTVLVPAPMDHLDPMREHRFFCPWKNADAQQIQQTDSGRRARAAGEDAEAAGWELLLQVIKNEAYLRSRETGGRKGGASGPRTSSRPEQSSPTSIPEEGSVMVEDYDEEEGEDAKSVEAKDKERWARLRRVKSLLQSKGTKKLRKSMTTSRPDSAASRPGTAHSTAKGDEVSIVNG